MSVELWKTIFDWASVVLVGLTFIAGAGALITGKILSNQQATQVRQFRGDLTRAQTVLAEQQERAAKAEGRIADAEQRSSEAQAKAEEFRLAIATAQAEAAKANRAAEDERLARVKIEEQLAGWRLSPQATARLVEMLKPFAGTPFDLSVNTSETRFMEALDSILSDKAGWKRQTPEVAKGAPIMLNNKSAMNGLKGYISIEIDSSQMADLGSAAQTLASGIKAEGIPVKLLEVTEHQGGASAIHIFIGARE